MLFCVFMSMYPLPSLIPRTLPRSLGMRLSLPTMSYNPSIVTYSRLLSLPKPHSQVPALFHCDRRNPPPPHLLPSSTPQLHVLYTQLFCLPVSFH